MAAMAIAITSDLVLDVMRAASPQKVASATARLSGKPSPAAAAAFAAEVNASGKVRNKSEARIASAGEPASTTASNSTARAKAHQKFEAAMLRSFTEDMLPARASSLYGEGTAGDIWRSLQVDLMSQKLASAGGIGIAEMLNKFDDRAQTAKSLSLNEIGGSARTGTSLSGKADWPYFLLRPEGEGG